MKRDNIIFSTILIVLVAFTLSSCADSKTFKVEDLEKSTGENVLYKTITVEPYGWADEDELKNPNIKYKISAGNVVCSILFVETIAVPVWLTGWQFYEPVAVKPCYPNCI